MDDHDRALTRIEHLYMSARCSEHWTFTCSAGFDINQFASGGALDDRVNDAFCELLESGPKPSVAAVEVRGTAVTSMVFTGRCRRSM